jgi:signal transduction histidine kinase
VSNLSASHGLALTAPADPAPLPWAWTTVGHWADSCAEAAPDANHAATDRSLVWDPGFAARRVWGLGNPMAPPEAVWAFTEPAEFEAVRLLWCSGIALGCAIDRAIDESGLNLPWKGLDWSIMLQGALWTMAARSPEHFRAWFEATDTAEKRRIEVAVLGTSADAWSHWILSRSGLEPVARALWMIKADPNPSTKPPRERDASASLTEIVRQGHAIASASRYALLPSGAFENASNDPRVALAEAMVKTVLVRFRLEAPDDAPLVRRSLALIRQTHRAEESRSQTSAATNLLNAIDDDIRRFVGPTSNGIMHELPAVGESQRNSQDGSVETDPPVNRLSQIESRWQRFRTTIWDQFRQWEDWAEEVGRSRADSELQAQASRFESLAEFAAGAGHELNNPLAVIQGRAQLLLARAADDQIRSSLKAIVDQTLRAHRMLRDLIFIARPGDPRPRLFRPADTLRGIVREFKPDSVRKNLQIQLRLAPELATLDLDRLDPDAYRHLATALVRNAIEASPEGGTVIVSLKNDAHGLALHVEDQGRGFDSNEAHHLFDPFYCGRRAGRGLGLGLPRVARIVAQMNGKIRFRSQPGQGTVFEVIVPAPPLRALALSNTA